MNTCYLVYRLTDNDRELVKVFSTTEKADEFIATLEKLVRALISYEYEEWTIE